MSKVSIIIPTLYPSSLLLEYAEKIRGFSSVKEVIIVINGDQRVLKKAENSTIKVIALGKNKGFTGACNAGARAATGKYLLFLNDDCEMDEENFVKLVDFLETNTTFTATQPIVYKFVNDNDQKTIENIGFLVDTKIGKANAVTDASTVHGAQFTVHNLYGLSGTCLLIRKEIFEKVGMWDESFHSYLEDVDLALRLRKFGYKFAPCLSASVTHAHMSTSKRMGMYKPMRDMINWWRLVVKHPDIFVHFDNLIPLLVERGRNVSGVLKKILVPT